MEIEELNAEVEHLLQSIGLQNSGIDSGCTNNSKFGSTRGAPTSKFMVPRPVSTTPNIAIVSTGGLLHLKRRLHRLSPGSPAQAGHVESPPTDMHAYLPIYLSICSCAALRLSYMRPRCCAVDFIYLAALRRGRLICQICLWRMT